MLAIAILNNFPELKAKLKSIRENKLFKVSHERSELTLNAQKIYDQLKLLCCKVPSKKCECQSGKVAIVTPIPPRKTGIADYVSELLPSLSKFYDIEIVTDAEVTYGNYSVRSIEYFESNVGCYSHIIYQVGNSPYHWYMFDLIRKFPGIVVLHDFYLGNLKHWMQANKKNYIGVWDDSLLDSHGYSSVYMRSRKGVIWAVNYYPVNVDILRNAKAIIVHSQHAKVLSISWYGQKYQNKFFYLPQVHKEFAGSKLENPQEFLVCSFGHITKQKCVYEIIEAWVNARLDQQENSRLVFVGGCDSDKYGNKIKEFVKPLANVEITGFVKDEEFQKYLKSANIAVQLRDESKGETSRTVLDCLAYGVPTVVNKVGAMAEFSDEVVYKIQGRFTLSELSSALIKLYKEEDLRETLSNNAKEMVATKHAPEIVAQKMRDIIEKVYAKKSELLPLSDLCANLQETQGFVSEQQLSDSVKEYEMKLRSFDVPSLYVDISALAEDDLKTGIQRVVRAILMSLYEIQPNLLDYNIVPVYLTDQNGYWHYRVAHNFMKSLVPDLVPRSDTVVEPSNLDVFIGLDFYSAVSEAVLAGLFEVWKQRGVSINFVVYDILPIICPEFFPDMAGNHHKHWLNSIIKVSDNILCISEAVAKDVRVYIDSLGIVATNLPKITFFHLGADIDSSLPSKGLLENDKFVLEEIKSKTNFLMVGTIEPRKGHGQVLKAFDNLWKEGFDVNFVIVGKKGWMVDKIIDMIERHPELSKRLFWLDSVSDECLQKVYQYSDCLIVASEGEGFGLPLIEAAQHELSIIARDIPVFREVAGEHAYYFKNDSSDIVLSNAFKGWLSLYKVGKHPSSSKMPWLTWRESTEKLLDCLDIKVRG